MAVYRIFTTKKKEHAAGDRAMLMDIKTALQISNLEDVKIFNRYDVEGISEEVFKNCRNTVFSEPQVDDALVELPVHSGKFFAVEYLTGQFDQRADSASQCIQFITRGNRPTVRTGKVIYLYGNITEDEFSKIKNYVINPVESTEASMEKPNTLESKMDIPTSVMVFDGFIDYTKAELEEFIAKFGLAMDIDDILFCQKYFKDTEKRNPTITEIRMIDTYWSDHCRHTTFNTNIEEIEINDEAVKESFDKYIKLRTEIGRTKPVTLMDLATFGARYLKQKGYMENLDESEEINACSVRIDVDVEGVEEKWLLMFKNETHNHPTEIEPFGGAATCLGGAIRDPLSGRSYVYQAMRVTGAADPTTPVSETIEGKLPQSKICTTAAEGYSSYGNQIGLATGFVSELYHPNYVAKRMEVGAVIAAAPMENVVREVPSKGDVVILLGGKTGRDGCGGATGSSKSHDSSSLESCGAEVQKGNAPEERKIQRLFRNGEVTKLIKRCNDFGAGGVSVAIGELADGIDIDLNKVPKKYEGLDATEIAISESQERMAVVIASENVDKFMSFAKGENIEATHVAVITDTNRLRMNWNDNMVVDISRDFLNTNGSPKYSSVKVGSFTAEKACNSGENLKSQWVNTISDLNVCSQRGLIERFDSTVGANTVLMPLGGKNQLTPIQAMCAKIPVLFKETSTCSLMSYGFDPYLAEENCFLGAYYAVISSVAKIIATGGDYKKCWFSFQEYFHRLGNDASRWGKPFSALLGALEAQLQLKIGAIGGKDSMSGTFEDIDVPPTLISFAVSTEHTNNIISPEFKKVGSYVYYINNTPNEKGLIDEEQLNNVFGQISSLIKEQKIISAYALTSGGICEAVSKMAFGNDIGVNLTGLNKEDLFIKSYGSFVVESTEELPIGTLIGRTTGDKTITVCEQSLALDELKKVWTSKLEGVYRTKSSDASAPVEPISFSAGKTFTSKTKVSKPKVLIPVFPGSNCEYDVAKAFINAGADANIIVIKNMKPEYIAESIESIKKEIASSQIIAIPGGFSGGDEPDGSGKFITSFFRNEEISDAVMELLKNRDGLMCGICNGFQALVKLGLVPYGEITDMKQTSPTLTFNTISRHQSRLAKTRVCSTNSPWFMHHNVGDVHNVALSHGEGKFIADKDMLDKMIKNGQIATQYVDLGGNPTMDIDFNPNGSVMAIEGITSPDGRVLGKMGHNERAGEGLYKNTGADTNNFIFKGAVDYFSL